MRSPEPESPEPERRTAQDRFGRLRYLDDESPAFSDKTLGPAPEAEEPPLKDRLSMVRDLSADWRKTTLPMQGLLDQSDRMSIGLDMARNGDMLAGSQAILISFNKLLDPTSVVRESEYGRSATGQSAIETLKGFADKLSKGGAGVTISELESYQRFGEQVVRRAMESTVGPERRRLERLVKFSGVDPQLVFTGRFKPQGDQEQGLPQAAAPALTQAAPGLVQAQEAPSPQSTPATVSRLAEALTGSRAPAQAPTFDTEQRIKDYATLPADALARLVTKMAAELAENPAAYTQQEVNAASAAYNAAFPYER